MPELPEVESLAAFLREHASGHAVARADAASFSVLKTFDPPLDALTGQVITEVGRHGKFLDLSTDRGLHLIMHLARAGWLRWRDSLPDQPPRPGKGPLALRLAKESMNRSEYLPFDEGYRVEQDYTARLLGLDRDATVAALGLAEYHGPLSPMMRCCAEPAMTKDACSWGALVGVQSALLAARGFTTPACEAEGTAAAAERVARARRVQLERQGTCNARLADAGREWRLDERSARPDPARRRSRPA